MATSTNMKITINDDPFHLEITNVPTDCMYSMMDRVQSLYTIFKNTDKHQCNCTCHDYQDSNENSVSNATNDNPDDIISYQVSDNFNSIRDRLPNDITVDISELTLEKAVQKDALIRCPHCGQAHVVILVVKSTMYVLIRNFNKNNFEVIDTFEAYDTDELNRIVYNGIEDAEKLSYFEALQKYSMDESINISAEDTSEMFCPVCQTSNPFMEWKNAWKNPDMYFGSKDICDVCGSILYASFNNDSDKTVHQTMYCPTCNYKPEVANDKK